MTKTICLQTKSGIHSMAFIICCLLFDTAAFSQSQWALNPNDYEHSMSITGTAWIDGQELDASDARVGAFIGETCLGEASPFLHEPTGRYLFFMVVFGNSEHIGSPVTFEIQRSGSQVAVQDQTLLFEVDATIGNVQQPFLIAEPKLAEGTDLISIDLGPGTIDVRISEGEIKIIIDASTSLTNMPVTFELSDGAVLWVAGEQWQSGETRLDYSSPMDILVYSQGLFNVKSYTLIISQEHDAFDANNFISPNDDTYNDFWKVSDPGRYQNYEFVIRSQGGEVVFEQTGYESPWDGYYKGKVLPSGTYWYVITNSSNGKEFRGYITLIY